MSTKEAQSQNRSYILCELSKSSCAGWIVYFPALRLSLPFNSQLLSWLKYCQLVICQAQKISRVII